MSKDFPVFNTQHVPGGVRFAIVAARFNGEIVEELLRRCIARFEEIGIERDRVDVHHVPGAFELPVAAKMLIESSDYAAVICLGCVIRGDTPHFDFVAGEAARGIQAVAISTRVPVIFGVLTTNTREQAMERLDAGARAADAAAEMIAFKEGLRSEPF